MQLEGFVLRHRNFLQRPAIHAVLADHIKRLLRAGLIGKWHAVHCFALLKGQRFEVPAAAAEQVPAPVSPTTVQQSLLESAAVAANGAAAARPLLHSNQQPSSSFVVRVAGKPALQSGCVVGTDDVASAAAHGAASKSVRAAADAPGQQQKALAGTMGSGALHRSPVALALRGDTES